MSSEDPFRRLENRFGVSAANVQAFVAVFDNAVPFDEKWLVVSDDVVFIGRLNGLSWENEQVNVSLEVLNGIRRIIGGFPHTKPISSDSVLVLGGMDFVVLSLGQRNPWTVNASELRHLDGQLQIWCTKLENLLADEGIMLTFSDIELPQPANSSHDPASLIVNMELPVRARAALHRCGATKIDDLRLIDAKDLASELKCDTQQAATMLSELVERANDSKESTDEE